MKFHEANFNMSSLQYTFMAFYPLYLSGWRKVLHKIYSILFCFAKVLLVLCYQITDFPSDLSIYQFFFWSLLKSRTLFSLFASSEIVTKTLWFLNALYFFVGLRGDWVFVGNTYLELNSGKFLWIYFDTSYFSSKKFLSV